MSCTIHFKSKQNEEHGFQRYLIFDRISDSKIINGGSGIRMPWADFYQKIDKREKGHLFGTQQ